VAFLDSAMDILKSGNTAIYFEEEFGGVTVNLSINDGFKIPLLKCLVGGGGHPFGCW
jgi:hypothetical protein